MEKPILATNIDGLLIKHSAFFEPHKEWFKKAIEKTQNKKLEKWIGKENYFVGVDEAMQQIMPNSTQEQRITQARKWYQEEVIAYIKKHPECVRKNIAKKLRKLKIKFEIILLTTNSKEYIEKILETAGLEEIYSGIIASQTEQEPDKKELLQELFQKYKKPKYYLTGKPDDKINKIIEENQIQIISEKDLEKI